MSKESKEYSRRERCLNRVVNYLKSLQEKSYIYKRIQEDFGYSKRSVQRFIKEAEEQLTIRDENLQSVREQHKAFLLKTVKDLFSKYEDSGKTTFLTAAQYWYTKLLEMYPNDLKPVEEVKDGNISITFQTPTTEQLIKTIEDKEDE